MHPPLANEPACEADKQGLQSEPSSSSVLPARPGKLLDRLRMMLHQRDHAPYQIEECARWIAAFIQHHGMRHPRELGPEHVAHFLRELRRDPAVTPQREVSVRAALRFLYEEF